ncbi:BACON domain-containing protein [Desertivirga xinjiangensis]|uniref:BACON domain-containing protein n=1 Tax=Desertivirga xinjiangensis TaxID=539206 RepID=UPI00210B9F55|nr:BACON domain-containing carbohydrate-binding protein [Pedobacter xinjiangensis]
METYNYYKKYGCIKFRGIACLLFLFLWAFSACKREFEMDLSLAVNSNELHLAATEGNTHIMIYSTGKWTARLSEEADWLSLSKLEGQGNTDITVTYARNFGVPRSATLILTKGAETQEIKIIQEGLNVALHFSKTKYTVPRTSLPVSLSLVGDLKYNVSDVKIDYLYDDETSEKWIAEPVITRTAFTFQTRENNSGRDRAVRITLSLKDGFGETLTFYADVQQTQQNASFTQEQEESKYTKRAVKDTVLLSGNTGASLAYVETNVVYESGAGWIEQVALANDNMLIVNLRANDTGLDRAATVQLRLMSKGAAIATLNHRIFQSAEDFEYYTFSELRRLIPGASGELALNDPLKALEGVVISDKANPNMETNPNITFNSMDLTETNRTAYIQASDGSYGFRLKTSSDADNNFIRYSKVSIALNGLTMVKESNPERYTIKGITGGNIVKTTPGTAAGLVSKVKTINALSDADMYTWVTFQNTEFAVPYGSYANVNAGYTMKSNWNQAGASTPYTDAIPSVIRDDNGGKMNLLVNTMAPWSRNALPAGSGTISGVIVHSKLIRFGAGSGDIGRYAVRPLNEDDIELGGAAKGKVIALWNWLRNGTDVSAAASIVRNAAGNVLPVTGNGELSCTVPGLTPSLGAHPVYQTDPASKAVPSSSLQYNTRWWNTTTNSGEGLVFRFSTSGITGRNLSINFSQGGGSGSAATLNVPVYWGVEYSLDGQNYTSLANSDYAVRPLAGWGLNLNYAALGLSTHSFVLPASLLDQQNVYVKLKAKQNIFGTNSPNGAESGTITATANNAAVTVRLGVVSFTYNQ